MCRHVCELVRAADSKLLCEIIMADNETSFNGFVQKQIKVAIKTAICKFVMWLMNNKAK